MQTQAHLDQSRARRMMDADLAHALEREQRRHSRDALHRWRAWFVSLVVAAAAFGAGAWWAAGLR